MHLYHVFNRGVDKRAIVLDDSDRVRFVHDLYALNDSNTVQHISQPSRSGGPTRYRRDPLVRIHAFCLMHNHYHFLLSDIAEGGISLFMQKFNMGYSKYFNERYGRTGALWQGKFKKVLLERDPHYMYVPYYIHLNPLDYSMPQWRTGNITDPDSALGHLREYRWSSHLDYIGEQNFPSVTYRDLLVDMFGGKKRYEREIRSLLSDMPVVSFPEN